MGSLVTGTGYIGIRLAQLLLDSGERVVGLDNLFSTDLAAIEMLAKRPGFTFVEGDVRDEDAVRRAFEAGVTIDTIYHLAAQASANPAAAPVRYTEETNLIGPRVVLEQACAAGASTFIFGGSIQLYGRRIEGVVSESHPFGPILDMSHLSKVHVEKLMEMYSQKRGIRAVSARIGLVYGLSPVMKSDPRFVTAPNKFCLQAARREVLRVDASAFNPTSMVHVDDAARGMMELARWPREGFSAVNLLGETASVADVAGIVQRIGASRGLNVLVEAPASEGAVAPCEFSSAMDEIGFAPRRSLEEGLVEVLDHWIAFHPHPNPLPEGEGARKTPLPLGEAARREARAGEGKGVETAS